jgi:hypothetical protein
MSYLSILKRKISENAPQCEATKVSEAPCVPFVAPESTPFGQILESNDPAAEARLAILLNVNTDSART